MAKSNSPTTLSLLLILLFVSTLTIFAAATDTDGPFIVAHKTATLKRLKSGAERVLVSIDLYNQGSATAYDVSLTDDTWPEGLFQLITGKTSNSWERLDAGSLVSHSFELETAVKSKFQGAPAVIKFRVPTKAALQEAYSTPIFPLDILEDVTPENKLDWAKRVLAKYGSVVSVLSIVSLFVYLVASPTSTSRASKKRR